MRNMADDEGVRRCAPRLLRYAQALGVSVGRLTPEHFAEEVHYGALGYEVVNRVALSRFRKRREWLDRGGLLRLTLYPKDVKTAGDLDRIVAKTLAGCCVPTLTIISRAERHRDVRFRCLLASDTHAHVACLMFKGPAVERLLRETRELRAAARLQPGK